MIDQSQFQEEVPTQLAPPETIKPSSTPEERAKQKQRQIKWLLIGGGSLFFLVLLVALIANQPAPTPPAPPPTPTVAPQKAPSALEKQLVVIDHVVKVADPESSPLEPPPVDMGVKF
jgi:hypothetical protein